MTINDADFNFDLFNPAQQNQPHTGSDHTFIYSAHEIHRFHEYVYMYTKEFPILETVDNLLVETFNFKSKVLVLPQNGVQKQFSQVRTTFLTCKEILHKTPKNTKEYMCLRQAYDYCFKSLKMTLAEISSPQDKSLINLGKELLDALK